MSMLRHLILFSNPFAINRPNHVFLKFTRISFSQNFSLYHTNPYLFFITIAFWKKMFLVYNIINSFFCNKIVHLSMVHNILYTRFTSHWVVLRSFLFKSKYEEKSIFLPWDFLLESSSSHHLALMLLSNIFTLSMSCILLHFIYIPLFNFKPKYRFCG